MALIKELSALEPFGAANAHPVFCLRRIKIVDHQRVGARGDHLKLRLAREPWARAKSGDVDESLAEFARRLANVRRVDQLCRVVIDDGGSAVGAAARMAIP